jgi:hypothetical protein
VLAVAEEIDATEEKIRRAVMDGMSLSEARRQHKYHQLQTKTMSGANASLTGRSQQ